MYQDVIKVKDYLNIEQIKEHLNGVEYIIMASPTTRSNPKYPIHFTIFLNTTDELPKDIQARIFEKFCKENKITTTIDELQMIGNVAFANVSKETYMPQFIFKDEDAATLPHVKMHIIDFEADAIGFKEPKEGKTGWSYSYN